MEKSINLENFEESLNIIRENGFEPIGVTTICLEFTFIFKTQKEAIEAYNLLEIEKGEVCGWWYGKENFTIAKVNYEKDMSEIYDDFELKVIWF